MPTKTTLTKTRPTLPLEAGSIWKHGKDPQLYLLICVNNFWSTVSLTGGANWTLNTSTPENATSKLTRVFGTVTLECT